MHDESKHCGDFFVVILLIWVYRESPLALVIDPKKPPFFAISCYAIHGLRATGPPLALLVNANLEY